MERRSMAISIELNNLIYPYFVIPGKEKKEVIKAFPGVYRFSIDRLIKDISEVRRLGLNKILLFGVPDKKNSEGSLAYEQGSIVSLAVAELRARFPGLVVFTDVCLCAYTSHGHCGVLNAKKHIDKKKTLDALSRVALVHAQAGADFVAPSAMAVGQVRAIRKALDTNGLRKVKIMGYSAKFASNFYGPFRNAADSAPRFGNRKGYQLDYRDAKQAFQEIRNDIDEGADIIMVKPALAYLDIIREAKVSFKVPLAAYNTSGEYALVKLGSKGRLWKEEEMVSEVITSIFRAGADLVITYHAKDIAKWQRGI